MIGLPRLALDHLEHTRGAWTPPHTPKAPPLPRLINIHLEKRSAQRLGGAVRRGKTRSWKQGVLPYEDGAVGLGAGGRVAAFWYGVSRGEGLETGDGLIGLNLHGGAYVAGTSHELVRLLCRS